ncbi:hypothetical protein V2J09_009469 [Rumex salicifolius]
MGQKIVALLLVFVMLLASEAGGGDMKGVSNFRRLLARIRKVEDDDDEGDEDDNGYRNWGVDDDSEP